MTSLLILGKRGGILRWYENLLDAAIFLPGTRISGFALNHNHWRERLQKRLFKLSGSAYGIATLTARNLKRAIRGAKPDVIIIADLFYLSDQILEVLQRTRSNACIAHWIGDFFDARLARASTVIDRYYFTDSSFIADAERLGIRDTGYLPLAANGKLFHPPVAGSRESRLLFVGAHSGNRQTMIDAIPVPKTVIGKGWKTTTYTADRLIDHNIPLERVAELYMQHELVLNVLNRNNVRQGLNMRCFEATACGAALLTEESPDNTLCFDPGNEILVYRDAADVGRLVNELHDDPARLTAIAAHGMQRSMAEHLYQHRLQAIIDSA